MDYKLAYPTWGEEELKAINDVAKSFNNTMGPKVKEFEEAFAEKVGIKYAVMVNSGSSANLLAIGAMCCARNPFLKPGDEVIVPALSWATTFAPLHQYGMKLVLVDIDLDTLNLDPYRMESALSPRTSAIMVVNILGNPANLDEIEDFCNLRGLRLIEDNCESMGAILNGRKTGTFGICGTYSMFFSHHINTIEGGVIVTNNEEIYQLLLAMRSHGWTRDIPGSKEKYEFIVPGYNVRPTEMAGAIGIEQLKKLDGFIWYRRTNAYHFKDVFGSSNVRIQEENGSSSWMGFPMIFNQKDGKEVIEILSKNGIEARPILAGNLIRQKMIKFMDYRVSGGLTNTDIADSRGIYVGNTHFNIRDKIDYLKEVLDANSCI